MPEIQKLGVIGAGTMGRGIAQIAAQNAGLTVVLYDIAEDMLSDATGQIAYFMNRSVEKGRMSQQEADAVVGRISTTMTHADFKDCDAVIEAAPERIDLKKSLFAELSEIVAADALLATNTSTFSVTEIAAAATNPARVVGMHYFNPPPLMPLVEVISGSETSAETMDAAVALAEAMGKTPVRVTDVPGFIVNRVARPFVLETLRLLAQGTADISTLDRLIREGGGFRMGPFELMDLVGMDINLAASDSIYTAYFRPARLRPSHLQAHKVASGQLGRKTGRGWYTYEQGKD